MAEDLQFKVGVDADLTGLKQLEAELQNVGATAKETASEFKGFTDEQKKQAQQLADSLPPLKKVTDQADELGKSLGAGGKALNGFGNVLKGLASGDLLQAGKGLYDIARAAQQAGGAMKELLTSFARASAVGAALGAPIVIATRIWQKEAEELDKQMQAIWAEQGQSTKRLAEEQEAAAQRAIESQERVAQAYRNTTAAINDQMRVASALAAEKTKQAQLGATSEGERTLLGDAVGVASAEADLSNAETRMHEADVAGDVEGFNKARDDITTFRARVQTAKMQQGRNAIIATKGGDKTIAGLSAKASEQQAAGDFLGQDATVKEIKAARAAIAANNKAMADAMKGLTDDQKRALQRVKATEEAKGN